LGDKIIVHVGDMQYEYEVVDMFVVDPDKISVLDQKYDASYVTLITCVPPGTFWKRLVVRTKLAQLP
jgi:sortase A